MPLIPRTAALTALAVLLAAAPAPAQTVSGVLFEDRDGDGIRDPGEPGLASVDVRLAGTPDAGGGFDQTAPTASDGSFSFSPGDGCYLILPEDPPGWRMSQTRRDGTPDGAPGYLFPVGRARFGKLDQGIGHLQSGALRFTAMGDSIAWNWNSCFFSERFWYSKQVRSRIACTFPSASVTLDEAAEKGEHTDDLLLDDNDNLNNVYRVIELQPDLVTISIIGNDLLDVEPPDGASQTQINRAVAELLDSRQNIQEVLSVLTSEIPGADIALNTLYDNEAWNCYSSGTSQFHRDWMPIVNRILRDLAWGQARRASINEAAAELAHADQLSRCSGFDQMICRDFLQTDLIHPNNNGYRILREKVWEAAGGVNLGSRDALGRNSIPDADYGLLRRVRRLFPSSWQTLGGASVQNPQAAMDDADGGAAAVITLGSGSEELRLAGFPDWFDEVRIVRVIAGARYRTTGTVNDDFYRMEASVGGQFRPPPGHAYTPTDWNYYTPIVGGGGPGQPPENPDFSGTELLALPDVPSWRDVSATLTRNPVLPGGAGDYEWPAVDHADLSTTAFRVASAPVAGTPGNDPYQVELDAAWLDLYGWEEPRPAEVSGLRTTLLGDGSLEVSFDPLAGADRYNLYFGRLATVRGGGYDHGTAAPAGPDCGAATSDAGGGRLKIVVPPGEQPAGDAYIIVTAHVDDVESPSGFRADLTERDRSQSTCR